MLYATGEVVETDWIEVWQAMCGSRRGAASASALARIAEVHHREINQRDGLRIVEAEEKFARESVGTRGVGDDCGRVGEKARVVSDIRIHPSAERREKVGALGKITRRLAV